MKRILIVEDEAILAKTLEESLIAMGYQPVAIADTGMKAILEFFAHDPDLILMDIRLKGAMDGIEAAEKIRSQKAVPIVFLTGNQDPALFERAKIEGAFGYVLKPFQERELQIVLEIALAQFESRRKSAALEQALQNSEKLGTVGTLAAGIIHDINGPLSLVLPSIDRMSELIRKDPALQANPEITTLAERIEKGARSVQAAVKNYRSLMDSTDTEAPAECNVLAVCKQAMELCRYSAAQNGVKFRELDSPPQLKVVCGPTSLVQVLVNLIRNACEAVSGKPDAWVELSWEETASRKLVLRVTDSGSGIPPEKRAKLFQPLYTTKAPGKGTGLGLSLCRRLLEKFNGTLTLDEAHPNTRFVIELNSG